MRRVYRVRGRTAALVRRWAREQRRGVQRRSDADLLHLLFDVRAQDATWDPRLPGHAPYRGLFLACGQELRRRRIVGRLKRLDATMRERERLMAGLRKEIERASIASGRLRVARRVAGEIECHVGAGGLDL